MSHDSNVRNVRNAWKVGKSACFQVVSTGRTFRKQGFKLLKRGLHKKLRKVEKHEKLWNCEIWKSLFHTSQGRYTRNKYQIINTRKSCLTIEFYECAFHEIDQYVSILRILWILWFSLNLNCDSFAIDLEKYWYQKLNNIHLLLTLLSSHKY